MEAVKISWFLRDCYPEGTSDEEILKQEDKFKRQKEKDLKEQLEAKEYLRKYGSGFKEFGNTDYVESLKKQKQIYDSYCKARDPKYKPLNIRNTLGLDNGIPDDFHYIQELAYHTEKFFQEVFNVKLEANEIGMLAEPYFKSYFEEGNEYLEDRVKHYKTNLIIMKQAFCNKKKIQSACELLESLGATYPRELEKAKYVIENFQRNQKRELLSEIINANFPFITQKTILDKIYKSSLQ